MAKLNPPCGNCSEKGCGVYHSEFKKYREFVEKREQEYTKRAKAAQMPSYKHPKYKNANGYWREIK